MIRRHVAVRRPLGGSAPRRGRGSPAPARRGIRRGGWLGVLLAITLALLGVPASPGSARADAVPDPDRASISAHTAADPGHVRDVADEATRDARRGPPGPSAVRETPDERHHLHHSPDAALAGRDSALPPPAGHRALALAVGVDPSLRRFALPPGRAPPSPRAPERP
ncbi:hypothetical protein [Embleya sp. NPDC050493]|uniref:hypothetical protein n=1 Tax=Embleya sp. NPDC050493 TaxID=3363989 RepID=UPI00378C900D